MQPVPSSIASQDSAPAFVPGGRRFTLVTPLSSTSRPTTVFMPVQVQGGSCGDIARYLVDPPPPLATLLFKYPSPNTLAFPPLLTKDLEQVTAMSKARLIHLLLIRVLHLMYVLPGCITAYVTYRHISACDCGTASLLTCPPHLSGVIPH